MFKTSLPGLPGLLSAWEVTPTLGRFGLHKGLPSDPLKKFLKVRLDSVAASQTCLPRSAHQLLWFNMLKEHEAMESLYVGQ